MTPQARAMDAVARLVDLTGREARVARLGTVVVVGFDRVTYRLDSPSDCDLLVGLAESEAAGAWDPIGRLGHVRNFPIGS